MPNSFPKTANLFLRRDRGSPQDSRVGTRIAEHRPYRIRASSLRPRALALTPQERAAAQQESWIAQHRLRLSRYTHGPWSQNHPCKPRSPWFQKPAPIEHFYRFLHRAKNPSANSRLLCPRSCCCAPLESFRSICLTFSCCSALRLEST